MKNTLLNNGRSIAYHAAALQLPGPPAVLLHGLCEDASVWEPVLTFFQNQPVLRIELPGFGASEPPLAPGMDKYADAVCAVLNELNIRRCILYGHSMGGYTALAFAQKHPERLAGFSLLHSHPFTDTPEQAENRRRAIALLQSGKLEAYVTQLFAGLFAPEFARNQPEVLQARVEKAKQGSAKGVIAALQGMLERENHEATLEKAGCPVQFILGALDPIISPNRALQAAALPQTADIRLLKGVAHMGMFEATEKTGRAMAEFWEFCKK